MLRVYIGPKPVRVRARSSIHAQSLKQVVYLVCRVGRGYQAVRGYQGARGFQGYPAYLADLECLQQPTYSIVKRQGLHNLIMRKEKEITTPLGILYKELKVDLSFPHSLIMTLSRAVITLTDVVTIMPATGKHRFCSNQHTALSSDMVFTVSS